VTRESRQRDRTVPYFVYRIHRTGGLERIGEAAAYRDASAQAKALRSSGELGSDWRIKVVFASTEAEAEVLLTEERARKPGLDGDE